MMLTLLFFIGNSSLGELPSDVNKNKYLCEKHFNSEDFRGNKHFYLKANAVPMPFRECSVLKVLTPKKNVFAQVCGKYIQGRFYARKKSVPNQQQRTTIFGKTCKKTSLKNLPEDHWTPRKLNLRKVNI